MIHVSGLEFAYGNEGFLLRVNDLQIKARSATAIVGSSGSGKSTLLQLLAGILRPDSGAITVGDTDLSSLSDAGRRSFRIRRIGLVFQDFQLLPYLSVLENVLLPARINPSLPLTDSLRGRARELLDQTGLGKLAQRSVHQLSQGERQRVAICRALIASPAVILADEPTGNLDPDSSDRLLTLFLDQVRTHGATLVMVTHDHTLLHRFDHVVRMEDLRDSVTAGQSVDGGAAGGIPV
ncbi:MAG: ABC transporter ATP-binding protein [Planctomycetaceae bacterium]|nr:ABC transporter ATP-binding protein [Planctomycetaceae bacterium]